MKAVPFGALFLAVLLGFSGLVVSTAPRAQAASTGPTRSFVLYGAVTGTSGWGFSATSIANPGPTLTVTQGKTYTFELLSQDGQAHTFFVDLNANGAPDPGEPLSPTFGGSSQPSVIDWSWTVSTSPGNYTYYCSIHLAAMKGALVIRSSSPSSGPGAPPDYTIYAAVVLIIAIVAIVAAVIIRRRPKSPPSQPPVQPPQRQG